MKKCAALLTFATFITWSLYAGAQTPSESSRSAAASATSIEPLPRRFEGKWFWQESITSSQYNNSLVLEIQNQKPDSSFRGSLSIAGIGTSCFAKDAPVTGTRDGDRMVITGVMGSCGVGQFELKKGTGHTYEGPYQLANGRPGIRRAVLSATR